MVSIETIHEILSVSERNIGAYYIEVQLGLGSTSSSNGGRTGGTSTVFLAPGWEGIAGPCTDGVSESVDIFAKPI